jgi:anti-anti-sigma factor
MRHLPTDGDDLITIGIKQVGEVRVVAVSGEVDVASGPRLRAELADVIDDGETRPLVVDLSAVTLLSSTGLAVLVDAHWQARRRGRSIVLVTGKDTRAVSLALYTAGIAGLFTTCTELSEAVRHCA